MLEQNVHSLFLTLLCVVLGFASEGLCQEEFLDSDSGNGQFELVSDKMGDLIHLSVVDKRLMVERDWDRRAARKSIDETPETRRQSQIKMMMARGMSEEMAEDMVDHELRRANRDGDKKSGIGKAFDEFRDKVPNAGSYRERGGGDKMEYHFSSKDFSGRVTLIGHAFALEFKELGGGGRRMEIAERSEQVFVLFKSSVGAIQ